MFLSQASRQEAALARSHPLFAADKGPLLLESNARVFFTQSSRIYHVWHFRSQSAHFCTPLRVIDDRNRVKVLSCCYIDYHSVSRYKCLICQRVLISVYKTVLGTG